jgi:hypothetical protein
LVNNKVFDSLTIGFTGTSDPVRIIGRDVMALLNLTYGSTPTITVNLEGSVDGNNWIIAATGTFTTGQLQKLVKTAGESYEFYRLNVTANTNVTVTTGHIVGSEI